MPLPNANTYIRPTDILADEVFSRLGNDGSGSFADLLSRIHQILGMPVEVKARQPNSRIIDVGTGVYTLPNSQRVMLYEYDSSSELVSGSIDFANGLISVGSVPSFSLPTMVAGNYIKALVSYDVKGTSFDVSFGSQAVSLGACTKPYVPRSFTPVTLVELHSTGGGVGVWDTIGDDDLVQLICNDFPVAPTSEVQSVGGSPQTVFNLITVVIPKDRGRLLILVNGVRYDKSYTVTSDTQVVFDNAIPANTLQVEFLVL